MHASTEPSLLAADVSAKSSSTTRPTSLGTHIRPFPKQWRTVRTITSALASETSKFARLRRETPVGALKTVRQKKVLTVQNQLNQHQRHASVKLDLSSMRTTQTSRTGLTRQLASLEKQRSDGQRSELAHCFIVRVAHPPFRTGTAETRGPFSNYRV
ncbi:hypothetical protein BCV70DRAFT_26245 [Testicularia cyperi]|uniref:Uncharacterized protein n=1 Tax=Testicularia cyperi TaxID=1882483 RepID=A0A317XK62_9BASI|nr:hypothetical protein BCV70DRAFT_26245 [Testicularia cyperi]